MVKEKKSKLRKVLTWMALTLLFAGLVWAAGELSGMANRRAQEAAAIGARDELASIETTMVKPQKKDNIAWGQIQNYEKQLRQNTRDYEKLVAQAGTEKQTGSVSASTKSAGMASAQKFNEISQQLAATWEKGNCKTRAKAVRAAGQSRLKNADVAFNMIDSDTMNAYNDQRVAMSEASDESLAEVKSDGSPQDLAKLKADMLPRLERMASDTTKLLGEIGKLLDQIRSAAGGDVGAMAGCAKSVVGGSAEGPGGLLNPVMSLMNMVKNMGSNIGTTMKALAAL